MRSRLSRFWREQFGADIPEYALLVALIAVGILAALYAYGLANSNSFGGAADGLKAAAPAASSGGGAGGGSGQGGSGGSGSGQSGQTGSGGSGSGDQGGDGGGGSGSGQAGGGSGGSQGGTGGTLPNNPKQIPQPKTGGGG